jgi:hypothetical protein
VILGLGLKNKEIFEVGLAIVCSVPGLLFA